MLFFSAASKLALLGVLPLGLAVPAGSPGVPKDQGIQVTIEKDLGTSETELTVLDRADSQVLGSSCSDQLNLPALNISVTADINNTGSGHLTIGNKKYIIHQRPDFSGGITCSKIYNDGQVFVTCDVPLAAIHISAIPLRRSIAPVRDCFQSRNRTANPGPSLRNHAMAMIHGQNIGSEPRPSPDETAGNDTTSLETRQVGANGCGTWYGQTRPASSLNPHQNYYLKQLSENQNCGTADTCGTGSTTTFSISVGFTVSTGSDANGFITAGFSVQASWSWAESHSCGVTEGETTCLWYNTAHTAYTVANWEANRCEGDHPTSDPFVMFSPNTDNAGGGYYCVTGSACRTIGSAYWDYSGRAGGP